MTSSLTGYSQDELLGQNVNKLMESSIASAHNEYLSRYIATGKSNIIGKGRDIKVQRKDGVLINAHLEVTKHEDKGKSSFVGTLTRIEAESLETFIDSHAKVLLSLDVPVIAIGIDGVIYFANKSAEDSFGFSSNTLKGNNVNILMTAAHAKVREQPNL